MIIKCINRINKDIPEINNPQKLYVIKMFIKDKNPKIKLRP